MVLGACSLCFLRPGAPQPHIDACESPQQQHSPSAACHSQRRAIDSSGNPTRRTRSPAQLTLTCSAVYNIVGCGLRKHCAILRRLDHAAIYFTIAVRLSAAAP